MSHPLGLAPSKIIAVHLNYPSRAAERGRIPAHPSYFLKPPSSLSAHDTPVVRPRGCELLTFEGEIAVVIGERARRVGVADALGHVRGYAASNDFGVYDLRYADRGSNLLAKGQDGYTPVGPVLLDAADVDPTRLRLRTWVNGELVQDGCTDELLFPFALLVADLSRLVTLEPGDIILTGTPAGARPVRPGDVVEVELEGSGRLRSPIVEADHELAPTGAMPRVTPEDRAAANGAVAAAPPSPTTATPSSTTASAGSAPSTVAGSAPGTVAGSAPEAVAGAAPAGSPTGSSTGDGGQTGAGTPSGTQAGSGEGIPAGVRTGGRTAGSPDAAERVVGRETLAELSKVSTATISSQLRKRGIDHVVIEGVRPTRPELRMAGFAHTLRFLPLREDVFAEQGGGMNAQKRAVEEIGPDEVLVIEARGDRGAGTMGDILALRVLRRGAAGIVTDGGLRDLDAVAALELPTWYAQPHAAVLGRRHVPLETGVPVACGGVLVMPGDVLIADAGGVVVVPPHLAAEVARDAQEQELQERFIIEQVDAGAGIEGLYPLGPERRAEYEAWRAQRGGGR